MSFKDKLGGLMKIGSEEDEYDSYDDEDDYVEESEPVKTSVEEHNKVKQFDKKSQPAPKRRIPMNDSSVCIFKPKSSDEAKDIALTLLENKTVVMNFEGVDISVSQRVLDIVTGTCIAIDGALQKISNFIFIATPASVEVSGELQDSISGAFDTL